MTHERGGAHQVEQKAKEYFSSEGKHRGLKEFSIFRE